MADDPKMAGYLSIQHFRETDDDYSSRRIRDMPRGRAMEKASLLPNEMSFGDIDLGDQSYPQIGVLTNVGLDRLPIQDISTVGPYTVNHDCPASLAPGESCSIAVTFVPKAPGMNTGGVYVNTGNAAGQEFIKFRGVGVGDGVVIPEDPDNPDPEPTGELDLSANSLAFAAVQVATTSTPKPITLTNSGIARMAITAITTEGQFIQTNNCGNGLDPGDSCTITVAFKPTTLGLKTGAVRITHDGAITPVPLTGSGSAVASLPVITIMDGVLVDEIDEEEPPVTTPATFSLPTPILNLASVAEGSSAVGYFDIMGSTEGAVNLTSLPVSSDGFIYTYAATMAGPFMSRLSYVIPQSGKLVCKVALTQEEGDHFQIVHVVTATQDLTVRVNGTVTAAPVLPGIQKRIRTVGNQFYQAQSSADMGGVLPAYGGIRLASVNWFGAEGTNFTPHGTWMVPWKGILDQIRGMGFNCIRLPFSGQMATNNPIVPDTAIDALTNPDLLGKRALVIFDMIIDYCQEIGIYVILDHHRRSAGAGTDDGPVSGDYTKAQWIASWSIMAARYKDKINVVGADVHNEPHLLEWNTWAGLAEDCGNAILTIAPNWIMFVQGVGNEGSDHYWWGGHMKGVHTRPVVLSAPNRIAYSPHTYGQSVGSQTWQKKDGNNPPGWPLNQAQVWYDYWGFIFYDNIAPVWVGEMGGFFGLDGMGQLTKPYRVEETEWMSHLVRFLDFDRNTDGTLGGQEAPQGGRAGISFAWWSFNPNSGDTGGLVRDDWVTPQTAKLNLLQPILDL